MEADATSKQGWLAGRHLLDMLLAEQIGTDGPHGWEMRAANCAETGCMQEPIHVTPACESPTPTWTEAFGTRPVPVFGAKLSLRAKETDAYCARCELSMTPTTSLARTLM